MKQIKIFLGGGVALLEGVKDNMGYRPFVVDPAISKLNSQNNAKRFYIVKTFSDLIHEYTPEGQQEHYHRYLEKETDIAIFIFDGRIGDKTKEEVERACNSNKKRKHPTVFFYGTNLSDDDDIVTYLKSKKQYYQHFDNREYLKELITSDLNQWKKNTFFVLMWEKVRPFILSVLCLLFLCVFACVIFKRCKAESTTDNIIRNDSVFVSSECDISLSLMKYEDLNKISNNAYNDTLLELFQYKKRINEKGELCIFPISSILTLDDDPSAIFMTPPCDSIPYHLPVLQLTMNSHNKEPIHFKQAEIEVERQNMSDSFYRLMRLKSTVVIVNESIIQQPCTLDYTYLLPEESFVKYAHHVNYNGISPSLEIPIPKNMKFLGQLNKKYQVDGAKVFTSIPTRHHVFHIKTINIEKGVRNYSISGYNWYSQGDTGVKNEFNRYLKQNEMDAEVFFALSSSSSCNIKLRIKLTDINNKVAYSNYLILSFIKPKSGFLNPLN